MVPPPYVGNQKFSVIVLSLSVVPRVVTFNDKTATVIRSMHVIVRLIL